MSQDPRVLVVNGGSSSIKFALFMLGEDPRPSFRGRIERIGLSGTALILGGTRETIDAPDHARAGEVLIDNLREQAGADAIRAVGHRVVHGGPGHHRPAWITPALLDDLHRILPFDPEHLPAEIALVEAFSRRRPGLPQYACFDTAFHHDLPRVARILPVPRRLEAEGVRRYGFHGLSYASLMQRLGDRGRVILAHLGNGASLAAVRDGKPMDTSMALTPAAGIPMSTRSGDLDPELAWYLARTEGMSPGDFHRMVTEESGLLGVSETSPDVRDLLEREGSDERAAEALALFCYQVKKWIGGFAAALGGVDTVVFTGGIGENAPAIRARICEGLEFLGIVLDPAKNRNNDEVISAAGAPVTVRVMATDEELMIARAAIPLLGRDPEGRTRS